MIGDVLILTEHLPVYTLGRTSRVEHVGEGWERGLINGIPVCPSDRGGSVTYHAPGQLIGYPILKLHTYCSGPKAYMALLEEVLIRALATFGLASVRRQGMPGVWVGTVGVSAGPPPAGKADRKIAALGVRISQGVTRHGFALNVVNDLTPFSAIVPCGLAGWGVTSVARETGTTVGLDQLSNAVTQAFQAVFGIALVEAESVQQLLSRAEAQIVAAALEV